MRHLSGSLDRQSPPACRLTHVHATSRACNAPEADLASATDSSPMDKLTLDGSAVGVDALAAVAAGKRVVILDDGAFKTVRRAV
jgi:hypothetical protein